MNKTVTINISGIIFHIEEDAYDKLSQYLSILKNSFSKTDGGNEIMSDIEARIAEMLQEKISAAKQVILADDVEFVINSMGKPEEFATESEGMASDAYEKKETENAYSEPIKKRLYRDGDNKVLGGVCSGIGHYFGFDSVWLRITLLLLLFFAGTGVLLYIILWIAIPEAKTTAEKLSMKGERLDINNISKAVKEEAEQLKKRMEKYGDEFKKTAANNHNVARNAVEKVIYFLMDILENIGKVLLKIIGILMVVLGVIFFLGLFSTVFGLSFMTNNTNSGEWIDLLFLDGKDFYLGILGVTIFIGVPVIMMIYSGVKILFKIRYSNRWVRLSAGIIWLFGFLILLYAGIKTGSDFNKTSKVREKFNVQSYDTLYLKMHEMPINAKEFNMDDENEEGEKEYIRINRRGENNYMIGMNDGIPYILGHAQLNIIKSQTDKMDIVIVKEAKGSTKLVATERAKNIFYVLSQKDSIIEFDNLFKVNNADKFRVQDLTVILKLPVGKVVYLDKSLENLMYDIENVTNTYDSDMLSRRWVMTESGLKCIDCEGLTSNKESEESEKEDVQINAQGLHITTKTDAIKMDSNGISIDDKSTKIRIDKHGIHIKDKSK